MAGAGTRVVARGLGVRFWFDGAQRVVTPGRARFSRRTKQVWGLHGLSFEISRGQGVALIGASGSGKTTLLRAIAGIMPADTGALEIEGTIGSLLSIDAGLTPTLTGAENAILLGVLSGLDRVEAKGALDEISGESALNDAFERPASSYSQGMQARLALAAAAQTEPSILLLDEVHEALDHDFRARLVERGRRMVEAGGIVIAAGHDHDMLGRLCGRALWLEGGGLQMDGSFEQVRSAYIDEHGG